MVRKHSLRYRSSLECREPTADNGAELIFWNVPRFYQTPLGQIVLVVLGEVAIPHGFVASREPIFGDHRNTWLSFLRLCSTRVGDEGLMLENTFLLELQRRCFRGRIL